MKKLCIWLIAFFVAVVAIDFGFGVGCRYLIKHAKGGFTRSHEYIANHCTEDVLIFGSSRAIHHYVPEIITDSLGMSCYNCGMDGNGILYLYSRYLMVTNRYTPKVIVYDVTNSFDLASDDYTRYLGWQKRYCDIPGVMDVITDISPNEKWKLKSNLYKYSGIFIQLVADNFSSLHDVDNTGYAPVYKNVDYGPDEVQQSDSTATHWDAKKKSYFEKLVSDCRQKGIKLIFAYSPMYGAKSSAVYKEFTEFCKEQDIPLIDYYAKEGFSDNQAFFADGSHLNDTGAKEYTKAVVGKIRRLIED